MTIVSSTPDPVAPADGTDGAEGPSLLEAAAFGVRMADELLLGTARDTHTAIGDRVHGVVRLGTGGLSTVPEVAHNGIAATVYASIGLALRGAAAGLDRAAATGRGPKLEAHPAGRFVAGSVNGLIGDRLAREHPTLALPMAPRVGGRDVRLDPAGLAEAYPAATGQVVVLLHGLCESDESWSRDRTRASYAEVLERRGWTPVLLRANTGLPVRENGVALASLMQRLVESWPVEVTRIALIGHSMGGLVMRAAGAVTGPHDTWTRLVSDVVTLGTPHHGAPLAHLAGRGSSLLGVLRESAAFGRILDQRSAGIRDLVEGLGEDVPPLPNARYRLVAATLARDPGNPLSRVLGDMLVREQSAYGRDRVGRTLFPTGEVLHVGATGHFGLLNHLEVHEALSRWLA